VLGGTGTELRRSPAAAAGSLTRVASRAGDWREREAREREGETGGDELRGKKRSGGFWEREG